MPTPTGRYRISNNAGKNWRILRAAFRMNQNNETIGVSSWAINGKLKQDWSYLIVLMTTEDKSWRLRWWFFYHVFWIYKKDCKHFWMTYVTGTLDWLSALWFIYRGLHLLNTYISLGKSPQSKYWWKARTLFKFK